VAENPAAIGTVRIQLTLTVGTTAAGGDTRNKYVIALLEVADSRTDLLHYAHALMAQRASFCDGGNITFKDVQISTADGGVQDSHNSVSRLFDDRACFVLPGFLARTLINESFH
jgi:hypothetical protein